jgi:hypothetical protein
MKTLAKNILALSLLLTASCSAIGYRAVTFAPCFPNEDKEKIDLKERIINYVSKADSS